MFEHIAKLERTLAASPPHCQVAFGLLMLKRLRQAFGEWVVTHSGPEAEKAFDELEALAERRGAGETSASGVRSLLAVIESLAWDEPDDDELEAFNSNGGLELLEVSLCLVSILLGDGMASNAAASAERVLNVVDYRLNMLDGLDDTYGSPLFASEVAWQESSLKHLSGISSNATTLVISQALSAVPNLADRSDD